jgi:hypothetical protein
VAAPAPTKNSRRRIMPDLPCLSEKVMPISAKHVPANGFR